MDMITISAKTLDEAITKALLELQITSDHLYYEVVQKESSGFLGIFGGKPCIIRARAKSDDEEKALKKEAAEKEKAAKAAAKAAAKTEKKAAKETVKETAKQPAKQPVKSVEKKNERSFAKPVEKQEEKPVEKTVNAVEKAAEKAQERAEKKENKREFERKKPQMKREEAPLKEEKPVEPKVRQPIKVDEEKVQKDAKEFLKQVFGAMDMTVQIETSYDAAEGELLVMMEGDDMGILIGKRGQTLDSLQYLVSLVVNKETEGYLRVKLDTENYRERRKETLETLAKNISYKVKRTKRPVSLEPMNPYERRIIHSALQNDRYVVTRSEGEDPYRHVVISLKKEAYGNGGGRKDRYQGRKDRDGKYERPARRHNDRRAEKSAEKNVETQSDNKTGDSVIQ